MRRINKFQVPVDMGVQRPLVIYYVHRIQLLNTKTISKKKNTEQITPQAYPQNALTQPTFWTSGHCSKNYIGPHARELYQERVRI